MSFSYVISLTILVLLLISIIIYTILRKKNIVEEPPGAFAAILFIVLILFTLSVVITIPSVMLYFVSLGVNFLFGEYITYDSFSSLLTFSLLVSVLSLFGSIFMLFIGKGITYLLKFPEWLTYILEFISLWGVIHFSIQFVLNLNLVKVSIWNNGTLILSFFVSFLFIGIDFIFSAFDQGDKNIDHHV
ncbi:hypothetical protein [Bacillus sp. NPDC093026]|uniref:hypothetical protein n=1 Tax=Bacillus sp. NPDC093026 TaxID=3363948 RepID=UPI003830BF74